MVSGTAGKQWQWNTCSYWWCGNRCWTWLIICQLHYKVPLSLQVKGRISWAWLLKLWKVSDLHEGFFTRSVLEKKKNRTMTPSLPWLQKVPRRYEVGSLIPDALTSVEFFYRRTYYEVIDHVVQAIHSRFDQDGYKTLSRLEKLLCNTKDDFDNSFKKKTFRKHSSHFVGTPFLAMQAVFSQDRYLLAESHDYLKLTNK